MTAEDAEKADLKLEIETSDVEIRDAKTLRTVIGFGTDGWANQINFAFWNTGGAMTRLRVLACVLAIAFAAVWCSAADRILFARLAPSQAQLFISNADGSGERALTKAEALDYNPAWSPKGDWIVLTSERAGSADLYRVHPDGAGLERLTDDPAYDDQAAFSPDGKQVVFVTTRAAGTANLWILDIATHKATPLTTGHGGDFRPAWSPDGKWIAFSSDRESSLPSAKGRWERLHQVDVYVVRADGSGLKRVSEHGNFCGSPKWTGDSKSVIAYCMSAEETYTYRFGEEDGETKLVQIDVATGETKPVAVGPGVKIYPSVLASGEIAYVRNDKSVHGIFYANGKPGPAGANINAPSWSPDGARLVYSRYTDHDSPEPTKVWSRNAKFELSGTAMLPACDPTGDRFAVTAPGNEPKTMSLFVVEEGKSARTILQKQDLLIGPQWSPDGKQIVLGVGNFPLFLGFGHGPAQVGIVNADGSGFHVITSGANNNAFPSFAPDGKRIVYRTTGPDGDGLRLMNLEDHSVTVLTKAYDNFPVWSPRGDLIAFVRKIGEDFEVFTIRPDGKDVSQLTHTKGNDSHVGWSPDGERLTFTSSRMGFKDEALYTDGGPQPYGEIFVMKYDGTQVEQLTDDQWEEGGAGWQVDKAARH